MNDCQLVYSGQSHILETYHPPNSDASRLPHTTMASHSAQSKQTSRVILVIAGLLVLTSMGYFAFQYFSEKQASENKSVRIQKLNSEVFALEEQIYEYEITLDDQKLDLITKNRELEERKRELEALAARLREARKSNKANLATITQLEQRVNILSRLLGQYEEEIAALQRANASLEGEVDRLQDSQTQLMDRNQSLLQEKDQALQELQETQELAGVLKTRDFEFYNLRRNRALQDTLFRRWGMKGLRICFTLIENPLAEAGPREIYLVYEGPEGAIYQPAEGGGRFEYGGQLREYTLRQTVDYQQLSQEVCLDFEPPPDFKYEKGPQYLSVYSQDNLIGQSSFRIK